MTSMERELKSLYAPYAHGDPMVRAGVLEKVFDFLPKDGMDSRAEKCAALARSSKYAGEKESAFIMAIRLLEKTVSLSAELRIDAVMAAARERITKSETAIARMAAQYAAFIETLQTGLALPFSVRVEKGMPNARNFSFGTLIYDAATADELILDMVKYGPAHLLFGEFPAFAKATALRRVGDKYALDAQALVAEMTRLSKAAQEYVMRNGSEAPVSFTPPPPAPQRAKRPVQCVRDAVRFRHLKIGDILTRKWKGSRIAVTVTAEGFEYAGTVYRTLMEAVIALNGGERPGHHSGWSFFGLAGKG